MKKGILLHEPTDDVGVAVMDIQAGQEIEAVTLEGQPVTSITVIEDVPLGHKVAMRDMPEGHHVQEYGRSIGYASQPIRMGAHVHVHNIKSLRWAASKAKVLEE
jgi:(2R)-sulfolactate sulfo-lyase subunit alpha